MGLFVTMLHACSIAILLFALLVTSHPTGFVTRANGTSARDVNAPDFYARILPLGASIVYGVGSSDGNGFRKPLRDALRQAGWKVNMVGNRANGTMSDNSVEARSGDRVDQIHEAAKTSFKYQPNIVLINGGTNDCDQDYDVDHVGERMDALLDDIFREIPGTTVILSTVIPSTKDSIASRRDRANNQYRSLVYNRRRILNQKIVLADMDSPGTTFLTTADLTGDGIHPTDGGHLKMAAIFLRAINEARGAGFVTPPNESAAASDDGAGGNTCNKVYGVARGPVNTQAGSGLDDGIYVHNSASRGVRMTVTRPNETAFWFAHISSPEFDDLSDLIEYGDPDPNMGGRWYTRFNALGAGQWNVAYPMQIWIPDGCIARGVRWADVNGDGVDDFLCISPNGDVYASVAQVSAIGDIGWGASPSLWKPNVGLPQARVRIADIDGDGRADYCVVADNGDISCWRNGGQGPMPDYWQPLGVVFTGKGMGDVNGVRFYDINGDGRDDWLWLNDKGETWTYTNNRGCAKGQEGQGLTPLWRAGENSVGGAGSTHHGLDIPDVRDQIYFAKAYGEGVVFGQLPRADYVRIEPVAGSGGQIEYRFHVWQNLGGGATKLKADGDRYCNMMGHANGAQDYVWIHSTGYMRIYESRGGSFPSEPPYWGPNYIIFDPPATMGRQINRRDLHLADWDGDGLCDIIYVDPIFFDMEVWINKYRENNDFSSWEHWTEGAELPILPARCTEERGKGVFDNPVRFADIDGNGLADFLCMEPDGRTWGLLNSNGGKTLTKLSQIKKTEGKDRANLHFADVNGDGLDDFLWINKFNGDTEVWYNRGPIPASGSAFTWEHQGALYQGAAQGSCIRYPDLDGNGRADMHVVDSLANTAVTWFNDCGNGGGDDTNTLTTPTLQPGPEVSEDVEGLMAAIHDSEYEGTISNDDVVSLATMLIGYTECDWSQRREVRSGWLQSWKLMDHVRPKVSNLDFNSAAAIEYLGPPAINQPYQYRIKEILGSIVTFKEGPSWRPGWFDYKIHVRCDDPSNKCSDKCQDGVISHTYAYTVNQPAYINFCPRYFDLDGLGAKLRQGGSNQNPRQRFDLDFYHLSQGFTWFHELLHLNDVSKATNGNEMLLDFWLKVNARNSAGRLFTAKVQAYGPELSKVLARWGSWPGVGFTHRNNDNIACFVLALLVQDRVLGGVYPHFPVVLAPPLDVSPREPLNIANLLLINPDGPATVLDEAYFSASEQCSSAAAEEGEMDLTYNFATRNQYPADYLALYDSWAAQLAA